VPTNRRRSNQHLHPPKNLRPLTVGLTSEMRADLEQLAVERGSPASQVVRDALREVIQRERRERSRVED